MSSSDPFELVRTKKWPSITGTPQQYAKDHCDWIKKLVDEVLNLKSEIDGLKSVCANNENTINELQRINDEQQNTINQLSSASFKNGLEGDIKKVVEDTAKTVTMAEALRRGLDTKSSDFEANLALANNKLLREKEIEEHHDLWPEMQQR